LAPFPGESTPRLYDRVVEVLRARFRRFLVVPSGMGFTLVSLNKSYLGLFIAQAFKRFIMLTAADVRDIVQTLFFALIGVITVLTYIRARKTLLQPIRTEVFKAQLQEFTAILSMLGGKGEIELRDEWGFSDFLRANCTAMFDEYAWTFFDVKIDPNNRPYNRTHCPVSRFKPESLEMADDYVVSDQSRSAKGGDRDPRVRAAQWATYKPSAIHLPKVMVQAQERLAKILESPLLPARCLAELRAFQDTVNADVDLIAKVLTDAAKEMPMKYGTPDTLARASFVWVANEYNRDFKELKPKAEAVVAFIRTYYDVESIME
jgi:hypothetical protein